MRRRTLIALVGTPSPLGALLVTALLTGTHLTFAAPPSSSDLAMHCLELTVTTPLPAGNVPLEPRLDLAAVVREHGGTGAVDANSIEVIDLASGERIPHARSDDFLYGDAGRIGWVITEPTRTKYEIRFRTAPTRLAPAPQDCTPMIGAGDLLRYNANATRSISLPYPSRLVDLTGDGRADLVGTWNYAYRPGDPWSGVVCYPRVGSDESFEFGDLVRVRYVDSRGSTDFRHLTEIYATADVADFNGDGLVDLLYVPRNGDELRFYWNTGERDPAGLPKFAAAGAVPRGTNAWEACRAVDLDGDDRVDVAIGGQWLRSRGVKNGLPDFAPPVQLAVDDVRCWFDVDDDGRPDAIIHEPAEGEGLSNYRLAWQRNLGSEPLEFAPPQLLDSINVVCELPFDVTAYEDGERRGLLVSSPPWQGGAFFECDAASAEFRLVGAATSRSAVIALGDQATPCVCDWDGDEDLDLLVGDGYGYPRIVINDGTRTAPRYREAQRLAADGAPLRLTRDEVLGSENWHDMGYLFPVYADWDDDGLPDLVLPNETNRIFWHKNEGARAAPKFGDRLQIICDGFPDSSERRAASGKLADDIKTPRQPYPLEKDQPFYWRTGAAIADFNADGLLDLVTADGFTRHATLFVQYRGDGGKLHLRRSGPLKLTDGRAIDQALVAGSRGWTEAYCAVDWNSDGLLDLVYSIGGKPSGGSIQLLLNSGTREVPVFSPPRAMAAFGEPINITNHGPHPWAGDLDGDGLPDLLAYVELSVYASYGHHALEMTAPPDYELRSWRSVEEGSAR